jgi:hypothetical protein
VSTEFEKYSFGEKWNSKTKPYKKNSSDDKHVFIRILFQSQQCKKKNQLTSNIKMDETRQKLLQNTRYEMFTVLNDRTMNSSDVMPHNLVERYQHLREHAATILTVQLHGITSQKDTVLMQNIKMLAL